MPVIPFGEYKPDLSDYEASTERDVLNVVPRGDGYGPFPSLAALSLSLGQQCRGAFAGYKADGSVVVFAGTSTDLWQLNNTTLGWSKVSLGAGPYSALSSTDNWQFIQYDTLVFATQANALLQVFNLSSDSAFSNALGSPPQARYIAVVGRFVVLGGLLSTPERVQWSGLDSVNGSQSWTAGVNSSDYQDLPTGGFVRGIGGGENSGVILQDTSIRSMIYLTGSPIIFQIEEIAPGMGIYGPYSLVEAPTAAGTSLFFYSLKGFQRIDPGGVPVPIGRERVDRTFFADIDAINPQLFVGMVDPRSTRIIWAYKSVNGTAAQFDKALCYDPVLDKFTPLQFSGEYLFQMARPGMTLEGLDPLAPGAQAVVGTANNGSGVVRVQVASTAFYSAANYPNGVYLSLSSVGGTTEANGNFWVHVIDSTHFDLYTNPGLTSGVAYVHAFTSGGGVGGSLDAMTESLDSWSTVILPELAAFNAGHQASTFSGANLEATLETSEQGTDGARIKLKKGFRPISDAPAIYGSASRRENQQQAITAGVESLINSITGICNLLVDTRYSRFKCRIPAGTVWQFINGVEPLDMAATGKR